MYGLYDIKAMNARKVAAHIKADDELEQARKVHKRLLVWQKAYGTMSQLMSEAADLIDSAYGVSED